MNLKHLAHSLEVPQGLLGLLVRDWKLIDGGTYYHTWTVVKRSGKLRTISAPQGPLKYAQSTVYHAILAKAELNPSAEGFVPCHSIHTNAQKHIGNELVINIDLKDFFPSISAGRVYGVFKKTLGFEPDVARFLTRLCTYKGALPQGSPASPALANIVCRRLDSRLSAAIATKDGVYSRYADDLTFSGKAEIRSLLPLIKKIIAEESFEIATKKTRIVRQGRRQEVTGLVVNKKVSIPRAQRRLLRAVVHRYVLKNTPQNPIPPSSTKLPRLNGKVLTRQQLNGHLAFLKSIHPEVGAKYLKQLSSIN